MPVLVNFSCSLVSASFTELFFFFCGWLPTRDFSLLTFSSSRVSFHSDCKLFTLSELETDSW